MFLTDRGTLIAAVLAALAGCADREVGYEIQQAGFGDEIRENDLAQIAAYGGDRALFGLSEDFRRSAPDMITFAFDSSVIDPTAQRALDQQAAWILRHPQMTSALIGASRVAQVEDAVGALNKLAFSADELQTIEQILAG